MRGSLVPTAREALVQAVELAVDRKGTNPADYGKAIEEMDVYLRTGIDGLLTDNPDTGVEAREQFWSKR